MANVASFTFNPFQENTYVLYDDSKECVIIDPGCYTKEEQDRLTSFIEQRGLTPVKILLTHAHIDHVLGLNFVHEKYDLPIIMHKDELPVLYVVPQYAGLYGIQVDELAAPSAFIDEGDKVTFGNTTLDVFFTPGHSPASVSFYCKESNFVMAGDVLFQRSIGRTDLPGGNFDTLINSIRKKLFPLGDSVKVYSGHGPSTTIEEERLYNPFLRN